MKTLVNTATIQWIHSMTKYHKAKVTTTKKQKIHVHFVSEIPQLGKQSKRSPRLPSHLEETNLVINFVHNNEVNTCTDIITYRNTPTGKTRKTFAPFAGHPGTPDFTSTWLDNNEIIHVSIYFQAHPAQALQLAITYQCCIQASLDQILATSASGTG